MKLLDRYILQTFFRFFFFSVLACAVIFVTVDLIDHLDKFIDANLSYWLVLRYYYLFVPYIVYLTLPVSVLLATLFTIGGLVARNEITAMQSAGYSLWRILTILLLVALPLSGLSLILGETIVPSSNHERQDIYRSQIKKSSNSASTRQGRMYIQVGMNEFLRMESYDPQTQTASLVSFQLFEGNHLVRRTDANKLIYRENGWVLKQVSTREFLKDRVVGSKADSLVRTDLGFSPKELAHANVEPEELNYFDLRDLVERFKAGGVRAEKWIVDLAFKISQPFANVIIVLFGVPFAAFRKRGGIVLGFGLSLLVCFVYFGFMQVSRILGYNGTLEPITAAWLGNIFFGVMGLFLVYRVPK